jgi:hypothetical protein
MWWYLVCWVGMTLGNSVSLCRLWRACYRLVVVIVGIGSWPGCALFSFFDFLDLSEPVSQVLCSSLLTCEFSPSSEALAVVAPLQVFWSSWSSWIIFFADDNSRINSSSLCWYSMQLLQLNHFLLVLWDRFLNIRLYRRHLVGGYWIFKQYLVKPEVSKDCSIMSKLVNPGFT